MKKYLIPALLVALAACSSGLNSAVKKGDIAPTFTDTKVDSTYLWVRGFGAANPNNTTEAQKKIMSREAAIAMGYQRAVEYIDGSGVTADVKVKDAIAQDSTIESKVQGLVKGMEVYDTQYMSDDGCTVIMRLELKKLKDQGITLQPN